MYDYEKKLNENLFDLINNINNPIILELGVQQGISTKKFLDICDKNNCKHFSVEI